MTLNEAKCGDIVVIKGIKEEDVLAKKLTAMGIRKNETFEVLKKCGRNLLIMNNSNRLVLSSEIANKIEVDIIKQNPCPIEEIKCEFTEEAYPDSEEYCQKRYRNQKIHRKGHRWSFFRRICPFLKD
ncbi:MAG: ferrous iron transport protein A [Caldimicrobium sp.]